MDHSKEALMLIERVYYMEGKTAEWRAATMRQIAQDVLDPDGGIEWARRLFPHHANAE